MQRRRRAKAEPKNIFGSSSNTKSSSKTKENMKVKHIKKISKPLPPSIPGSIPKSSTKDNQLSVVKEKMEIKEEEINENIVKEEEEEVIEVEDIDSIVEKQIFPEERKTLGLTKNVEAKKSIPISEIKHSSKAKEIIDKSTARAIQNNQIIKNTSDKKIENVKIKEKNKVKPKKKIRNNVSSYQPANRAKRLDRSRHMEYKYEMRRILDEIDVLEEYRSNILATVWARGERQTSKEANDFLIDKVSEGIIDENQMSILKKLVDGYTIRR